MIKIGEFWFNGGACIEDHLATMDAALCPDCPDLGRDRVVKTRQPRRFVSRNRGSA
jgi:hypothetical protein